MANWWNKIAPAIKSRDIFGVPVQLTYKGQVAFNTVTGGIFSIIFLLTFLVGFVYQLYMVTSDPEFMNYPPKIDFSETSATIYTTTGTTMAFAVNKFEADENQVRV